MTNYVSFGVLAEMVPRSRIDAVLAATGRGSRRQRDLQAHVVVYYVIALALYRQSSCREVLYRQSSCREVLYRQSSCREVLRCVFESVEWIWGSAAVRIAGKSGISHARTSGEYH